MIRSFACKETKALFERELIRKIPADIQRTALRKLKMLDAAVTLGDLKSPPANRLEKLQGSRRGQYSIRINDQWRVCFRFENSEASSVEIVDYH
ncbi:MAG TPA: type II toxin-antitoxin system RelE/ParE family toxin [bacterium]|nr:type II toxin-antitoxin system RelE/ParE family toxin [bacterium]